MKAKDVAHCTQCGDLIDTHEPGHAQAVSGWRVNRGARGGANQIALACPEPRWLCRFCLDRRRQGLSFDQLALFEER